jgi:excisionase family DNA binding protein
MTEPNNEMMWAITDAAKYLGVTERTLRKWDDTYRLPAIKTAGGHRRWTKRQLDEFLDSTRNGKLFMPIEIIGVDKARTSKPNPLTGRYSVSLTLNTVPSSEWHVTFRQSPGINGQIAISGNIMTIGNTTFEDVLKSLPLFKEAVERANIKMDELSSEFRKHEEKIAWFESVLEEELRK